MTTKGHIKHSPEFKGMLQKLDQDYHAKRWQRRWAGLKESLKVTPLVIVKGLGLAFVVFLIWGTISEIGKERRRELKRCWDHTVSISECGG
jgi:hypothetical protein